MSNQLTDTQVKVLAALREAERGRHRGAEVPADAVRERAQDVGVSYDATFRALRALATAGIVTRPRRGRYVLSDAPTYTLDGANFFPVPD